MGEASGVINSVLFTAEGPRPARRQRLRLRRHQWRQRLAGAAATHVTTLLLQQKIKAPHTPPKVLVQREMGMDLPKRACQSMSLSPTHFNDESMMECV
jgi:hypothetical protein